MIPLFVLNNGLQHLNNQNKYESRTNTYFEHLVVLSYLNHKINEEIIKNKVEKSKE